MLGSDAHARTTAQPAQPPVKREEFAFHVLCAERPVPPIGQRVSLIKPGSLAFVGSDGFLSLKPRIEDMRQELMDARMDDPHMIDEADAATAGFYDDDGNLHDFFDDASAAIVQV